MSGSGTGRWPGAHMTLAYGGAPLPTTPGVPSVPIVPNAPNTTIPVYPFINTGTAQYIPNLPVIGHVRICATIDYDGNLRLKVYVNDKMKVESVASANHLAIRLTLNNRALQFQVTREGETLDVGVLETGDVLGSSHAKANSINLEIDL